MDDPRLRRLYVAWRAPTAARSNDDIAYAIGVLTDLFSVSDGLTRLRALCGRGDVTTAEVVAYYRKWCCILKDYHDVEPWRVEIKKFRRVLAGMNDSGRDSTKPTPAELLESLCLKLRGSSLSKKGSALYRPMCDLVGNYLHAYEPAGDIKTFVYNACSEEGSDLLEGTAAKGNLITQFVERLTVITDARNLIDNYTPDPRLYAFRNGVFNIDTLEFIEHDDLTPDDVAIIYHDLDFNTGDLSDQATPALDTILHAQGIVGDHYLLFMAVVFGRTLFPCTRDNWQRIVLLFGESGTGKSVSTILTGVGACMPDLDVGTHLRDGRGWPEAFP